MGDRKRRAKEYELGRKAGGLQGTLYAYGSFSYRIILAASIW